VLRVGRSTGTGSGATLGVVDVLIDGYLLEELANSWSLHTDLDLGGS
jgi:hypothetical protein